MPCEVAALGRHDAPFGTVRFRRDLPAPKQIPRRKAVPGAAWLDVNGHGAGRRALGGDSYGALHQGDVVAAWKSVAAVASGGLRHVTVGAAAAAFVRARVLTHGALHQLRASSG